MSRPFYVGRGFYPALGRVLLEEAANLRARGATPTRALSAICRSLVGTAAQAAAQAGVSREVFLRVCTRAADEAWPQGAPARAPATEIPPEPAFWFPSRGGDA